MTFRTSNNKLILKVTGAVISSVNTNGGTYVANYNEVFPVNFITLSALETIDKIGIKITESFDGAGATLKLGNTLDDDAFFETTEVELTEEMTFEKDFSEDGPQTLKLTIVPGSAASQGQVKIQISTTKQGV